MGFGFYGSVIRQWLSEGWKPNFDKTELIGIEGFEEYRNPCWQLYDHIYIDDIKTAISNKSIGKFDFIIFSDVLEHFCHNEGEQIIKDLFSLLNVDGELLIGTPAIFCQQGAVYGNEFERHQSIWNSGEIYRMAVDMNADATILKNGETDFYGHCMILVKLRRFQ